MKLLHNGQKGGYDVLFNALRIVQNLELISDGEALTRTL